MILAFDLGIATAGACLLSDNGEASLHATSTSLKPGSKNNSWAERINEIVDWASPFAYHAGNNGAVFACESMSFARHHNATVSTAASFAIYQTLARVNSRTRIVSVPPKQWREFISGKKGKAASDAAVYDALAMQHDLDKLCANIRPPALRIHAKDALCIAKYARAHIDKKELKP
jgi:hypothetical protein